MTSQLISREDRAKRPTIKDFRSTNQTLNYALELR